MRNAKKTIACMATLAVVFAMQSAMAQSAKLEGVWRITEVTISGPNTQTYTNLPPTSLLIFTKRHYSIMYDRATTDKPRPSLPRENATDAQKLAAWTPFTANAGTYEVKGTTVTTRPVVAKNPNAMEASTTFDSKIEGNTLSLTAKANAAGPIANPPIFKLVRLE